MIVRRLTLSLLLLAAPTAALRAATPAGPDPKSAKAAAEPAPASSAPATTNAAEPAAKSTATAAEPASVSSAPATDAVPAPTESAAPVIKPGILTAVKAKGPPPIGNSPTAPVPLSPRFQQIRTKIGALFNTRNSPPTPADPRTNPFRPAGAAPLAPLPVIEGADPVPVVANSDLVTLQQAVATLRVKGTVQRGKIMQLVITSAPGKEGTYKEGDIINVALPTGDPAHVRVRQISPRSVTLTLNEAEMVLKF